MEWELRDINGDGYPDFVYNASFVRAADPVLPPASPGTPQERFVATVVPTDMAGSRDVKVLINTAGAHLADGTELFASPITLEVGGPNGCGISRWQADASSVTGGILNETCGFEDVNGDGIADRITSVVQNGQLVTQAALGTGVPDHPYSNDAIITLPGPLARTETYLLVDTDRDMVVPRNCRPPLGGDSATFDTRRTRGLRDINGDGIPDYIAGQLQEREPGLWTVALGTGAGYTPPITVDTPVGLELSWERSPCRTPERGELAATPTGLYDIDGDGQPEVVNLNLANPGSPHWEIFQLKPPVDQVDVGPGASVPAAGRLVKIDNGYGAITRIGYQSAKADPHSHHNVPFPEIVVSVVTTTDASDVRLAAITYYAYHGAGLIFDAASDAFIFPGYQRTVAVRSAPDGNVATITDTYGLAPFDPSMDAAARFTRLLKVGRVSDVTVMSGGVGADPWAWGLMDISPSIFRRSSVHYDWAARLLPPGPAPRGE